jgi:hypothetical protein
VVCGQWVEEGWVAETVRSYRELQIWRKGIEVVKIVYALVELEFIDNNDAQPIFNQII